MSGNICQYLGCHKSKKNFPKLKMFRFPRDERMGTWTINSGNVRLIHLDKKTIYNRYLCQEHFTPDCFTTKEMTKLTKTAVPCKFDDYDLPSTSSSTATKTLKRPAQNNSNVSSSSMINKISETDDVLRKQKFKKKLQQSNKLKNKRCRIAILKTKLKMYKTQKNMYNIINSLPFPSTNSKALVTMQLRKNHRPWSAEEKQLSLKLFYKSPAAYYYLKLQNINLLSTSSIRQWIGKSKFLPGFNKIFLNHIKKKFEFKTIKEKKCTLCFKEISIEECLEFSRSFNLIEGFEDFGTFGRTNNVANTALVFMARGIYSPWKIPVAYYLACSAVESGMLKDLLVYVLQTLFEAGLHPKLIVCDQSCINNQSALKLLNVTESKPFFYINDNKVYAIFDVPHLIKSIRHELLGCSFKKKEKTICYSDIEEAFKIDTKADKNIDLLNITSAHIYPDSLQKMSVKFADQILSNNMALAIRNCYYANKLTSKTALDTADFINFINILSDCLDSRSLYSKNIFNCALSDTNCVKSFLENASLYFVDLYKLSEKSETTRPPCFSGFTQTINGILTFFEDEKKDNIQYLLTNRLNLDAIETLFSSFHQMRGCNKKPTVRIIRTSFRRTAIYSLVSPSKDTNYKENLDNKADNEIVIVENQKSSDTFTEIKTELFDSDYLFSFLFSDSNDNPAVTEKAKAMQDYIVVFSGYLAYINLKKFDCNNCRLQLTTNTIISDKDKLSIINKSFSNNENILTNGLKSPSKQLVDLVNCMLNIFEDKFVKVQYKKNIKLIFMIWFKKCNLIKTWLDENKECLEHKHLIIDELLTCKILQKCRLFNKLLNLK